MRTNFLAFEIGVLLFVFVAVIAIWGAFRLKAWVRQWELRRSMRRAQVLEKRALHFLKERGFQCIGEQIEKEAFFLIDGRRVPFRVRVDYLLERDGKKYVAEVKTGKQAKTPEHPSVRRQLLEYALLFAPCSILFVDGEEKKVHEISFPWSFGLVRAVWWVGIASFLGGFVIGRWSK